MAPSNMNTNIEYPEYITQEVDELRDTINTSILMLRRIGDHYVFYNIREFIEEHYDDNGKVSMQRVNEIYDDLRDLFSEIEELLCWNVNYHYIEDNKREMYTYGMDRLFDYVLDIFLLYKKDDESDNE
jgi:hypothetical protein